MKVFFLFEPFQFSNCEKFLHEITVFESKSYMYLLILLIYENFLARSELFKAETVVYSEHMCNVR